MTDDLIRRLRLQSEVSLMLLPKDHVYVSHNEAADRIEKLEDALLDIFDYECRTSDKSLIACTARDALWPEKEGDKDER